MRHLLLLRHAKAALHAGGGDKERPLTQRGRDDALRIGQYLTSKQLHPNLAVASDARRTRQTLECVAEAMNRKFKIVYDPDLYLASESALLVEFHKAPDIVKTLLVVGHNPGMAEFALRMSGTGDAAKRDRLNVKFPTASLAVLQFDAARWSEIGWGTGHLAEFVTPSMLSADAEESD